MTTIGNHSFDKGFITQVRRKGRILQLDSEWLLLCRDEDVAKILKKKLSGPMNDNLESVDFDPDEETTHPVSIQLGPYVSKMIHLTSYSNTHDQSISGWGLNLDDLDLLERAGFGYRP